MKPGWTIHFKTICGLQVHNNSEHISTTKILQNKKFKLLDYKKTSMLPLQFIFSSHKWLSSIFALIKSTYLFTCTPSAECLQRSLVRRADAASQYGSLSASNRWFAYRFPSSIISHCSARFVICMHCGFIDTHTTGTETLTRTATHFATASRQ